MRTEFNKTQFDQVVLDQIEREKSKPPPPKDPNCWEKMNNDCKKRLMGTGCCLLTVLVLTLIMIRQSNKGNGTQFGDTSSSPTSSPTQTPSATASATQTPSATASATASAIPSATFIPSSSFPGEGSEDDSNIMSLTLMELIGVMILFCGFIMIAFCCYCKCKGTRNRTVRVAPRQIVYDVQE